MDESDVMRHAITVRSQGIKILRGFFIESFLYFWDAVDTIPNCSSSNHFCWTISYKQTRNSHLAKIKKKYLDLMCTESNVKHGLPPRQIPYKMEVNNHWMVSLGISQTCSFMVKVMQYRCKFSGVKCFCFLKEKMTELNLKIVLPHIFLKDFFVYIGSIPSKNSFLS